jgi:hypothetical protein
MNYTFLADLLDLYVQGRPAQTKAHSLFKRQQGQFHAHLALMNIEKWVFIKYQYFLILSKGKG